MPIEIKYSDEFEGDKDTIEVELVDYGNGDRIKFARKMYLKSSEKPTYKPLGTISKKEASDLIETMQKILSL
jgi:hypothetical protein